MGFSNSHGDVSEMTFIWACSSGTSVESGTPVESGTSVESGTTVGISYASDCGIFSNVFGFSGAGAESVSVSDGVISSNVNFFGTEAESS